MRFFCSNEMLNFSYNAYMVNRNLISSRLSKINLIRPITFCLFITYKICSKTASPTCSLRKLVISNTGLSKCPLVSKNMFGQISYAVLGIHLSLVISNTGLISTNIVWTNFIFFFTFQLIKLIRTLFASILNSGVSK